jgi:hypothetical protein
LLRIRFSRSRFDSGAASEWYRRRQDGILAAASIPSPQVPSPAQRRRRTSGNTLSFDATELKNLHGHEDMEDTPSTNDPGSPPANAVMRRSSVEEWHTPGADVPTGDEDQENKVASPGDVSAPGTRVERSEDGSSPSICGLKSRDAEEKCSVDEENLSMVSACSGGSEEEGIVQAGKFRFCLTWYHLIYVVDGWGFSDQCLAFTSYDVLLVCVGFFCLFACGSM